MRRNKQFDVRPTGMIIEVEIIERIEDEPLGRSVNWVCDMIASLGRDDPFGVLRGMWRGGYIALIDGHGEPSPQWKCEELWRDREQSRGARLIATEKGLNWIHGPSD